MVSQKQLIGALLGDEIDGPMSRQAIAEWIEAEGIAPPDGWVLVPSEPTAEMRKTFCADIGASTNFTHTHLQCADFDSRYRAMLAAAPKGVSHD